MHVRKIAIKIPRFHVVKEQPPHPNSRITGDSCRTQVSLFTRPITAVMHKFHHITNDSCRAQVPPHH